ncbi:unnamed protein product [Rotaria magnacalcarata]|nr:unnamed protein product [Rotaria magnacalcarata]
MVAGALRIIQLLTPEQYNSSYTNATKPSALYASDQVKAAFIIDWFACIFAALTGCYIALLFITIPCCCCAVICIDGSKPERQQKYFNSLWKLNVANSRFITLSCNCPWYKARPQLRFHVRLAIMTISAVLHIICIILYATDRKTGAVSIIAAGSSGFSFIFVMLIIGLDYFQYRIWWHYRPDGVDRKGFCCCAREESDSRHERFLPSPLAAKYRDPHEIGNQPCAYSANGNCPNLSLQHIAIFHAYDSMPQHRYDNGIHTMYFGFHQTSSVAALSIAREGFRSSTAGLLMLGHGVYFARSFAGTDPKARHKGALICAEVRMGNVLPVVYDTLHTVSNSDAWHQTHDTVYYYHRNEQCDEFCVKDPKQVLKWIIIMDDDKIRRYGLDKAFENTLCKCI